MKLYQKLESASFPLERNEYDDVELYVHNGSIGLCMDLDYKDYYGTCKTIELSEQKLIELRNFINSLLEEQE